MARFLCSRAYRDYPADSEYNERRRLYALCAAPSAEFDEAPLRAAVIGLAGQYGHYGYRLITGFLQPAGCEPSRPRVERIWKQEGLKVPQKQPKRGRPQTSDEGPRVSRACTGRDRD